MCIRDRGKVLIFKPKEPTSPKAVIDETNILNAEYSEDRWELKNRVIVVGAGGQILADVSEGEGDLPVVVHYPDLADPKEAERRARIRLALNREYGKELRVEMSRYHFDCLGVELGDTVTVNLPRLGLNGENMAILGIEYDFRRMRVRLTIGGFHQLTMEILAEQIGGDVASRFGRAITIPEQTSTLAYSLDKISRIQADQKHVLYVNKPPLTLYNAQNIILNSDGEAELASGVTEGSFEAQVLPPSELFINWIKAEWMAEKNGGEISAQFLNADGESLGQVYDAYDTQFYRFRKWPQGYGSFTYKNASSFGVNGASISDKRMGILHAYCLKLMPDSLGMDGEIYYPSSQDLNLDLSWAKWLRLYLYADHDSDVTIKIRLHQDASNYFEASLIVKAKEWRKYEVSMDSLSQIGSPSLSNINWISIISPYPILIDSDHVFLPATRELMRVKFTLKRDSPDDPSPKIRLVKIIWREGA